MNFLIFRELLNKSDPAKKGQDLNLRDRLFVYFAFTCDFITSYPSAVIALSTSSTANFFFIKVKLTLPIKQKLDASFVDVLKRLHGIFNLLNTRRWQTNASS